MRTSFKKEIEEFNIFNFCWRLFMCFAAIVFITSCIAFLSKAINEKSLKFGMILNRGTMEFIVASAICYIASKFKNFN